MARPRSETLAERLAVYLVADPAFATVPLPSAVADALDGGVTCVQMRAKALTDRDAVWLGKELRHLCSRSDALFIVNDRVDIALACGADGVHLGVDDLPLAEARQLGGPDFLIGYSPDSDADSADAVSRGADYLGIGPVYGTASKSDAGEAIGLETLARRTHRAGIPTVGIGGITVENAGAVIETGAAGVAVVSAILRADDIRSAASRLAEQVRRARAIG